MSFTDSDLVSNISSSDSDLLCNLPSVDSDLPNLSSIDSVASGSSSDSGTTFTRQGLVRYLSSNFISFEDQGLSSLDLILDAVLLCSETIPALKRLSKFRKMDLMLNSMKANLDFIARHARQSGLYHAILGALVGDGVDATDLSEVLGVDLRTAKKSLSLIRTRKDHFENTGLRLPVIQKPVIHRLRMAPQVFERIESFFKAQCTPSADRSKKKRKRIGPGNYEQKGVMYRTSTLSKMLSLYRVISWLCGFLKFLLISKYF